MQWFGEPWPSDALRSPVCDDDAYRVPVPVGDACLFCTEPICANDRGVVTPWIGVGPDGEPVGHIGVGHIECLMCWDPSQTAAANRADAKQVELPDWLGG